MNFLKVALLLFLGFVALSQGQVAQDKAALLSLYNALGGPSWTVTWNFALNLCLNSTKTVSCDSTFNVVEVNLAGRNLVGTIPSGVGGFKTLLRLYLSSNPKLTGNLPTEIGLLTNLTGIQVQDTGINGQIPTEIALLSKLTSLRMFNCFMTGTIPTQIGALSTTRFNDLQIHNNLLTGTIPTELANLKALTTLGISRNRLTGTIPTQLASFPKVAQFDIYKNLLTGTIPTQFAQNQVITRFWVADNQLSGTVPFSIFTSMSKLQYLYLERNNFTGAIGTEIGQLGTSLLSVRIMENQIDGSIPPEVANVPNLAEFYIFGNQIGGSLPTEIGNMAKLERFWLWSNSITGTIPTEIGNMPKLNLFRAQGNELTGNLPTQIAKIPNLQGLWLSSNNLTGTIPSEFGTAPALQQLLLGQNQLSGEIPTEMAKISTLQRLYVNENQLSGSIPTHLGLLPALLELNMSSNALSGSVPTQLGQLTTLQRIDFTNNQIVGVLPDELLSIPAAQQIMLVTNCLLDVPDYAFFGTYDYPGFHDLPILSTCEKGAYETKILADSPKAFFRFEKHRPSYDHAIGADNLINPFGTFRYARVDSPYNYALVNSGVANRAITPNKYNFTKGFTVEAIFEAKTIINAYPVCFNPNNTNLNARTFNIRVNAASNQLQISNGGSGLVSVRIRLGQSYHVAVTYTGRYLSTYVNGALVSNITWTSWATSILNVGQYIWVGESLNGYVDEVSVWDSVLSTAQIQNHYNSLKWCSNHTCGTKECYANSRRSSQCEIEPDQRTALAALWNSTKGSSWGFLNWNTTDDLCRYNITASNVVYCDAAGNVIHLELANRAGLNGVLPPAFFNLPKLAYLNIRANLNLVSTIPTEIGNLQSIRYLNLFGNRLNGTIPTEIANLPKVYNISLCCQQMTGSLPTEIGKLTTLRQFGVHLNQMTGTLPNIFSGLTNMIRLEFYSNYFTGSIPPSFVSMKNLQVLAISVNKFSGTFPTEILALNKIFVITVANNQFSGTIPTELASFPLVGLDISYNQFSGTIPTVLIKEPLKSFTANNNTLTGPFPSGFETLSTMRFGNETNLFLAGNQLDCPPMDYSTWAWKNDYSTYAAGCSQT